MFFIIYESFIINFRAISSITLLKYNIQNIK